MSIVLCIVYVDVVVNVDVVFLLMVLVMVDCVGVYVYNVSHVIVNLVFLSMLL